MTLTHDFLRILHVKPGTEVSATGSPGSRRAFFTASTFFRPPLSLAQTAEYPGLADQPARDLVAMRCNPDPQNAPAILATWPNVFAAIKTDLESKGFSCPAPAGLADNQAYCAALQFTDTPGAVVLTGLANAFAVAAIFFDPAFPERATWPRTNYGIYPAFSGLGLAVKGTYYLGPEQPISVAQALQQSVVPEYLLPNLSLAEAGCRCIAVSPYSGREQDLLDPDFIAQTGSYGACVRVNKLSAAAR